MIFISDIAKKFKYILVFIGYLFIISSMIAENSNDYPKIYNSSNWERIDFNFIQKKMTDYDVLLLGEEHFDVSGHKLKQEWIQSLNNDYRISISMEQFETDQQDILNEYLNGYIDNKIFLRDIREWDNYLKDYSPIVEFAKSYKLPVIASNAPDRYVKILSRYGLNKLYSIPDESQKYLPPLYTITMFQQEKYKHKFYQLMGTDTTHAVNQNLFLAQNLRDASMAEQVFKHFKKMDRKIIHINGRFHSDENMGVAYRLKQLGLQVLNVSMFQINEESEINQNLSTFGDIIVITSKR